MKKLLIILLIVLCPVSGFSMLKDLATSVEHTHAMKPDSSTEMLSPVTVNNVKAMVYVKDFDENMAEVGMSHTHHLMVVFEGANRAILETGEAILTLSKQKVAVAQVPLKKMGNQFGSDLTLDDESVYQLLIEYEALGEEKRQYPFRYLTK